MGRVTGMRRWVLTAALFAGALVFLVVAVFSHSAVPLFVMWVPLLTVPWVLSRPDPSPHHPRVVEQPEDNRGAEGSGTSETNQT